MTLTRSQSILFFLNRRIFLIAFYTQTVPCQEQGLGEDSGRDFLYFTLMDLSQNYNYKITITKIMTQGCDGGKKQNLRPN